MHMTSNEIRQKFLEFFKSKGHTIIPSESLIPENDPTVLFTTAGMHPLVPYLMGEKHPGGNRVANVQKCIRTSDIDEVGDRTHHTFFEMLGNWSFGDYFKKEALEWSWEFLTSPDWLGLDKNRLAVSVFKGDDDAPFDEEAYNIWKNLGISEKRIAKLGKKENWWGPAGETGPCGADSEMFYWTGDPNNIPESFNDDNESWVEIWNDVFMEFNKTKEEKFEQLKQKNVDTGMGLERILSVMNGLSDNYKSDLFENIIKKIEELSGKKYDDSDAVTKAMRVIADHIKASCFIMGDKKGIGPSNTDQGYIVRRLIRRAIGYANRIDMNGKLWTRELAKIVIFDYLSVYSELKENENFILTEIENEEKKFIQTLERGEKEFDKWIKQEGSCTQNVIPGDVAFKLFATYGFPIELTIEMAREKGKKVDIEEFEKELQKHQELSRTASAGKFKGGLADASMETKRLHTTAHLMLAALRKVLGEHVQQKGSNITAERLRFDFSHSDKLTDQEKNEVEQLVNEAIDKEMDITMEEMTVEEAKNKGAVGVFDSKYGEKVKVYKISDGDKIFSYEICGGPHVDNTRELGKFKIKKEQSSSSGVRRIKAVLS